MTQKLTLATLICAMTLIVGCSIIPEAYRIDIPQGNLISEEKVSQLKIGMNRRQVQHILGSPLLVDTFNQNRWDYFYSVEDKKGTRIEHHITIVFSNDLVSEIIDNQ